MPQLLIMIPKLIPILYLILLGDKLNTYYENRLALIKPENERYDCRNEFVIFLPIDPKITKTAHLKVIILKQIGQFTNEIM